MFSIFLFIVGSIILFPAYKAIKWRLSARSWSFADAKIIDNPGLDSKAMFAAKALIAEYFVNGERYLGENIDPGGISYESYFGIPGYSKPPITNLDFPYGGVVPIFFDPADPQSSALRRPSIVIPVLNFMFGLGAIILGFAAIAISFPGIN